MRLTSTVPAFRQLATLPTAARRRRAWPSYEATAPEVFEAYFGGWANRDGVGAAATRADSLLADLGALEARAERAAQASEDALRAAGLIDPDPVDDLDVVLLVGVAASNGWVTGVGGRATLFLALESLPDPPYDVVLAVHEGVHLAVERRRRGPWPDGLVQALVDEGLATAVSRRLVPGLGDSAYLWFDDEHASWVRDCAALEAAVVRRAARLADADAPPDELFLLGHGGPLPERSGYWLADRLLTRSLSTRTVDEVMAWTPEQARTEVGRLLGAPDEQ